MYTEGTAPQTFSLRFADRNDILGNRKEYKVMPTFQFQCGEGTVSVLDPIDDLLMTHGAAFEQCTLESNHSGYRLGFTIRWLQSAKDFYVDTCGMRVDNQALAKVNNNRRSNLLFPEYVRNIRT